MKHISSKYSENQATRGWFVGDFFPDGHPAKTDKMEICFHEHKAGECMEPHLHQIKVELIIILKGTAEYWVDNQMFLLGSGDYLFIQPNSKISAKFIEDTQLFAVHAPSLPNDKVVIKD